MSRGGRRQAWAAGAGTALASCALAAAALGAPDDVLLASVATGGAKGNAASAGAAISADGTRVAFSSTATNLDPADGDGLEDVYVRDLAAGTTTLVSRATGAGGAKADGSSTTPAISGDGRYVAFVSHAKNLDPADADAGADVYVRDLRAATTALASRAPGDGGAKGNGASLAPSISGDGARVAFVSQATNLDPADRDALSDVYVRDLGGATTVLASRATGGAKGNFGGADAALSGDGRTVAFASQSTNLAPGDGDTTLDVYVRDLDRATTALASVSSGGTKADGVAASTSISADGHRVAFSSSARNLDPADGDAVFDVFVRDLAAGTTALASRASAGAKGDANSLSPELSRDGRRVAFHSSAANLDPGDRDRLLDVFVRDLDVPATVLASRAAGAAGAKGDGPSFAAALSADGGLAAFASEATNLDPRDGDATSDVYVRELGFGPPPPPAQPPPASPPPAPGLSPALVPAAPAKVGTDPPRPRAGRAELVQPLAGAVLVRPRGARRFTRVRGATVIPDGSEIDATRGRLRLTVDARRGRTSSAVVSGGRAIVDQDAASRPTTTLSLSGPLACPRRARSAAAIRPDRTRSTAAGRAARTRAAAAAPPARALRERRLSVRAAGGRWRTSGRYATATARGTAWVTADRCDATRIDAREGAVLVRELLRGRRVRLLRAPRRYTAARRGAEPVTAAAATRARAWPGA